jgi:hypothetical protein
MWTKPAWASCRRPPDGTCTDRLIIRRRTVESAHDIDTREVLACDESFFAALLAADHDLLGTILADDFLIVDVLSGQVARREEPLGAISSGQLRFTEVTRTPRNDRSGFVPRPPWWQGEPRWSCATREMR